MTGWRSGEPTLADIEHEFPRWRCAQGNSGLYYAENAATGQHVSGEDPLDLRDQIKAAEARRTYGSPLPAVSERLLTAPGRAALRSPARAEITM